MTVSPGSTQNIVVSVGDGAIAHSERLLAEAARDAAAASEANADADATTAHTDRLAADASAASAASDAALVSAALSAAQLSTIPFVSGGSAIKGGRLRYATQCYDTEFEVMASHTSNANPLVDLAAGRLRVVAQERRLSKQFVYPIGWTGRVIPIYFRDDGTPTTPYDHDYAFRRAFMAPPGTTGAAGDKTYWVTKSGNDANGGLTKGDALLTMSAALGKADVLTIMVEGSTTAYTWTAPGTKSVNIIGFGSVKPRFFTSPGASLSVFTATGGYTNVFQATGAFAVERPCSPFVLDEHGLPLGYEEVGSIAAVATKPMSFYYDVATKTIYVEAETAPVVGTDIYVTLQNFGNATFVSANANANKIIYLENLIFTHGVSSLSADGGNLRALNVFAQAGQNTSVPPFTLGGTAGAEVVFKGCIAAYSGSDGFNIQSGDYTEIDCIAYGSGFQGASSQSSTVHDGVNALRIRGRYENNAQQAITDVGSAKTINIGVTVDGPTNVSCIATAATREMWNYDCHVAGEGLHYQANDTSIIHIDGKIRGLRRGGTNSSGISLEPQLFTPTSLSGLKLWLDSSDPATITIATGVSQWKDKSGQSNHATQATGSKQPTVSASALNGKDTLAFASAASQVLDLTSPITVNGANEWTILCVAKKSAVGQMIVSLGSADSASFPARATTLAIDSKLYAYSPAKQVVSNAGTYGDAAAYHWHAVRHAAADTFELFFDSAAAVADTESAFTSVTNWSHVGAGLGSSDFYTNGNIAEIIYFDRVLTDAEMALFDTYFADKYAI